MPAIDLAHRKCVPCDGNARRLDADRIRDLAGQLPSWQSKDERLHKTFAFRDFVTVMEFLNRVAEVAETERHHPDFCVHYNRVEFTIFTHAVGGLSENDFILAAKIDALV
ncbi:MAG TPA: 4a-hydroxytetrahydrobiopterin dehydratase [Polyangiaceae bacterium]